MASTHYKLVAPLRLPMLQPGTTGVVQRGAPPVYRPEPLTSVRKTAPGVYGSNVFSAPGLQPVMSPAANSRSRPASGKPVLFKAISAPAVYRPMPLVQQKAANIIPAICRPLPPVIQRAAAPTVISDVFEDFRELPAAPSVANLRQWMGSSVWRQGSVNSYIQYAERTAKIGGGSRWEIGFTFYLRQYGSLSARWYWHVHAEGNSAGVINSVASAHFKEGHRSRDRNISESGYGESVALLTDLYRAHNTPWTAGDEVTL